MIAFPDVPPGGFPVVVADPPWKMTNAGTRLAPQYEGDQRAASRYQVMTTADLEAMGTAVQSLLAPDAFLFLWAPNALVLDGTATRIARAWGTEPKQLIPWVKTAGDGETPRIGGGNYSRVVTEQLILCRRGKAKVVRHDIPGVIIAPRRGHSEKPAAAYVLIERLCGPGPKLELFARSRWSPSWITWGDQAPTPRVLPAQIPKATDRYPRPLPSNEDGIAWAQRIERENEARRKAEAKRRRRA